MIKKMLHQYQSRRNCACLLETDIGVIIQKQYHQESAYRRELLVYEKLRTSDLPHARILQSGDMTICLANLPGKTLLEVLESQEAFGHVEKTVWQKLADWMVEFSRVTGFVMTDVNLRNFLWEEESETVYGLDFEECAEGELITSAARLAAYIRTYTPEQTPVKQKIAKIVLEEFSRRLGADLQMLFLETEKQEACLKLRRMGRT